MKRLFALLLTIAVLLCGFAFAEGAAELKPVVVLFTNDVHCGIEDGIGYAGLAAYEKAYAAKGYEVLLADNGDAIQGGPIGTLSQGEYITDIMNEIGYDVATIGNHEFDYGIDQLDEGVRQYFDSLLLFAVARVYTETLAVYKQHPFLYRKYMFKFEY